MPRVQGFWIYLRNGPQTTNHDHKKSFFIFFFCFFSTWPLVTSVKWPLSATINNSKFTLTVDPCHCEPNPMTMPPGHVIGLHRRYFYSKGHKFLVPTTIRPAYKMHFSRDAAIYEMGDLLIGGVWYCI